MITYADRTAAQQDIVLEWGEDGKAVLEECFKITPFNDTFKEYLSHCTACGGNWGGMLLSGIKKLWPEVWEAIPEDMGVHAFTVICSVLICCGVDTSK